mgnify:CR=1 FL=1
MIELLLEQQRSFETPAAPAQAFALLGAIPDSAAHFPGLEALIPVPPDGYTWRLEKTGVGKLSLQASWTSRYTYEPEQGRVSWTPLPGGGNSQVSGQWRITPRAGGSRIEFQNRALLTLPVPKLMKGMVEGFVRRENERLIDGYLANLGKTLAGGSGRLR